MLVLQGRLVYGNGLRGMVSLGTVVSMFWFLSSWARSGEKDHLGACHVALEFAQ
jgi:hypothetical protein